LNGRQVGLLVDEGSKSLEHLLWRKLLRELGGNRSMKRGEILLLHGVTKIE
jgi:hypothetical protein